MEKQAITFETYLENKYIKKEAHFPLAPPKIFYVSKDNHREVHIDRIKELYKLGD
jgi:hypothetical protein